MARALDSSCDEAERISVASGRVGRVFGLKLNSTTNFQAKTVYCQAKTGLNQFELPRRH